MATGKNIPASSCSCCRPWKNMMYHVQPGGEPPPEPAEAGAPGKKEEEL
jgi:hypothetical protein